MTSAFKYAHSSASQWHDATQVCLTLLGEIPASANLGFIYVTDIFASDMRNILALVKEKTGIEQWVGSAGLVIVGKTRKVCSGNSPSMMAIAG